MFHLYQKLFKTFYSLYNILEVSKTSKLNETPTTRIFFRTGPPLFTDRFELATFNEG
jgi:hypothetical protein